MTTTLHTRCRACSGRLVEVLTLGDLMKLNAFPATLDEVARVPAAPLTLMVCQSCSLCQLAHTVEPDLLYREYWYRSGVNEMMREELEDVVYTAGHVRPLQLGEQVLDIGANDGTLLSYYPKLWPAARAFMVAVEPAYNLGDALRPHADLVIHDYFPFTGKGQMIADRLAETKFAHITAVAMCYDLEDPIGFFRGIRDLLADDGVAIVQFQDLGQMIEAGAFDNICHEHLEYYTLWSLRGILGQAGLRIADCETRQINGGSLRVQLRHEHWVPPADPVARRRYDQGQARVFQQFAHESELGLSLSTIQLQGDLSIFRKFRARVDATVRQVRGLLDQTRDEAAVVDLYGASTKGNIFLQVLGIGPNDVRCAIDRSPAKAGRFTITGIPIVESLAAGARPADLWFVPIWQFRASVLTREAEFLARGGRMVFAMPTVEVVAAQVAWGPEREREVV